MAAVVVNVFIQLIQQFLDLGTERIVLGGERGILLLELPEAAFQRRQPFQQTINQHDKFTARQSQYCDSRIGCSFHLLHHAPYITMITA